MAAAASASWNFMLLQQQDAKAEQSSTQLNSQVGSLAISPYQISSTQSGIFIGEQNASYTLSQMFPNVDVLNIKTIYINYNNQIYVTTIISNDPYTWYCQFVDINIKYISPPTVFNRVIPNPDPNTNLNDPKEQFLLFASTDQPPAGPVQIAAASGSYNYNKNLQYVADIISNFPNSSTNTALTNTQASTITIYNSTGTNAGFPYTMYISSSHLQTLTGIDALYFYADPSRYSPIPSTPNYYTTNLLAYWDFNNATSYSGSGTVWRDLTSNGYNINLNGNGTFNSPGMTINANSNLKSLNWNIAQTATTTKPLSNITNAISIEILFMIGNVWDLQWLFNNGNGYGGNGAFSLYINQDQLKFFCGANSNPVILQSVILPNTWYHMIITLSNSSTVPIAIYINGILQQLSYPIFFNSAFPLNTTQKLNIGNFDDNENRYSGPSNGSKIAMARIYNVALTQVQVQQNYNTISYIISTTPGYYNVQINTSSGSTFYGFFFDNNNNPIPLPNFITSSFSFNQSGIYAAVSRVPTTNQIAYASASYNYNQTQIANAIANASASYNYNANQKYAAASASYNWNNKPQMTNPIQLNQSSSLIIIPDPNTSPSSIIIKNSPNSLQSLFPSGTPASTTYDKIQTIFIFYNRQFYYTQVNQNNPGTPSFWKCEMYSHQDNTKLSSLPDEFNSKPQISSNNFILFVSTSQLPISISDIQALASSSWNYNLPQNSTQLVSDPNINILLDPSNSNGIYISDNINTSRPLSQIYTNVTTSNVQTLNIYYNNIYYQLSVLPKSDNYTWYCIFVDNKYAVINMPSGFSSLLTSMIAYNSGGGANGTTPLPNYTIYASTAPTPPQIGAASASYNYNQKQAATAAASASFNYNNQLETSQLTSNSNNGTILSPTQLSQFAITLTAVANNPNYNVTVTSSFNSYLTALPILKTIDAIYFFYAGTGNFYNIQFNAIVGGNYNSINGTFFDMNNNIIPPPSELFRSSTTFSLNQNGIFVSISNTPTVNQIGLASASYNYNQAQNYATASASYNWNQNPTPSGIQLTNNSYVYISPDLNNIDRINIRLTLPSNSTLSNSLDSLFPAGSAFKSDQVKTIFIFYNNQFYYATVDHRTPSLWNCNLWDHSSNTVLTQIPPEFNQIINSNQYILVVSTSALPTSSNDLASASASFNYNNQQIISNLSNLGTILTPIQNTQFAISIVITNLNNPNVTINSNFNSYLNTYANGSSLLNLKTVDSLYFYYNSKLYNVEFNNINNINSITGTFFDSNDNIITPPPELFTSSNTLSLSSLNLKNQNSNYVALSSTPTVYQNAVASASYNYNKQQAANAAASASFNYNNKLAANAAASASYNFNQQQKADAIASASYNWAQMLQDKANASASYNFNNLQTANAIASASYNYNQQQKANALASASYNFNQQQAANAAASASYNYNKQQLANAQASASWLWNIPPNTTQLIANPSNANPSNANTVVGINPYTDNKTSNTGIYIGDIDGDRTLNSIFFSSLPQLPTGAVIESFDSGSSDPSSYGMLLSSSTPITPATVASAVQVIYIYYNGKYYPAVIVRQDDYTWYCQFIDSNYNYIPRPDVFNSPITSNYTIYASTVATPKQLGNASASYNWNKQLAANAVASASYNYNAVQNANAAASASYNYNVNQKYATASASYNWNQNLSILSYGTMIKPSNNNITISPNTQLAPNSIKISFNSSVSFPENIISIYIFYNSSFYYCKINNQGPTYFNCLMYSHTDNTQLPSIPPEFNNKINSSQFLLIVSTNDLPASANDVATASASYNYNLQQAADAKASASYNFNQQQIANAQASASYNHNQKLQDLQNKANASASYNFNQQQVANAIASASWNYNLPANTTQLISDPDVPLIPYVDSSGNTGIYIGDSNGDRTLAQVYTNVNTSNVQNIYIYYNNTYYNMIVSQTDGYLWYCQFVDNKYNIIKRPAVFDNVISSMQQINTGTASASSMMSVPSYTLYASVLPTPIQIAAASGSYNYNQQQQALANASASYAFNTAQNIKAAASASYNWQSQPNVTNGIQLPYNPNVNITPDLSMPYRITIQVPPPNTLQSLFPPGNDPNAYKAIKTIYIFYNSQFYYTKVNNISPSYWKCDMYSHQDNSLLPSVPPEFKNKINSSQFLLIVSTSGTFPATLNDIAAASASYNTALQNAATAAASASYNYNQQQKAIANASASYNFNQQQAATAAASASWTYAQQQAALAAAASAKWNLDQNIAAIQCNKNSILKSNSPSAAAAMQVQVDNVKMVQKSMNNTVAVPTIQASSPVPSNSYVTGYQRFNYQGESVSLTPGLNQVSNIKSIAVPAGRNVTLYPSNDLNQTNNIINIPGPGVDPMNIKTPVARVQVS